MPFDYDDQNIFAKILRGEIPNDTVAETEHSLAFNDIGPQAPVHVLVVPKGPYVSHDHFCAEASRPRWRFLRLTARVVAEKGLSPGMAGRATGSSAMPARTACRKCRISTSTSSAAGPSAGSSRRPDAPGGAMAPAGRRDPA